MVECPDSHPPADVVYLPWWLRVHHNVCRHQLECSFSGWSYGNAIILDAMLDAATYLPSAATTQGAAWADDRLDNWVKDSTSPASLILANVTIPWPPAIGDTIGLYPFAYLSRAQYHSRKGAAPYDNRTDLMLATRTAGQYILGWPVHAADGTITRKATGTPCWTRHTCACLHAAAYPCTIHPSWCM